MRITKSGRLDEFDEIMSRDIRNFNDSLENEESKKLE